MKRSVKRQKPTKPANEDLNPLLSPDLPTTDATPRLQAAHIKIQHSHARGTSTDRT